MKEKLLTDLDNAVNLLNGVWAELDNLSHEDDDTAYQLYIDAEELHIKLKEEFE